MTYCVSDIHGEYELFLSLLEKIHLSDDDTLIVCGDIIDKGCGSVKLLNKLSRMKNAVCILGNHELAFLRYYWSIMHTSPTDFDMTLEKLRDYFPTDGELLDWEIVDWLESLPYYIEAQDYICVHAGVPLDENLHVLPLSLALPEQLVNDRHFKEPFVLPRDSKCVLFGHTPTCYMGNEPIIKYPKVGKDANSKAISDYCKIHLDTGVWESRILGAFCIDTCEIFYVKNNKNARC